MYKHVQLTAVQLAVASQLVSACEQLRHKHAGGAPRAAHLYYLRATYAREHAHHT